MTDAPNIPESVETDALTDEELEARIEALTEESTELEQDYQSIGFEITEEV